MKLLYKYNKSFDIQTIKIKLEDRELEVQVSYLSNLVAMSQSFAIDTYINILKDKYIRRKVIKNCTNLLNDISKDEDINKSIYSFENNIRKIMDKEEDDSIEFICQQLLSFLENKSLGFKFGISFLDDVIGRLFKGEITTFAARGGIGKTARVLQIMLNAISQKKKVVFISRYE